MPLNLSPSQGVTQGVRKQDGVAIVDRRLGIPIEDISSLATKAAADADF
jgi:hypothetical protein